MRNRDDIKAARRQLKAEYGELFDAVTALLFRHDPVGINFELNPDEYEPEVETILPRLHSCHSAEEVRRVAHEEFVRWFDSALAGPEEAYTQLANEIWQLWQEKKSK